jgi:hypothetical protein
VAVKSGGGTGGLDLLWVMLRMGDGEPASLIPEPLALLLFGQPDVALTPGAIAPATV